LLRRFVRQDDGAAAVEFAMVLLPFLTFLFLIIETAIVFFAQQALETAVTNAARLVMTGQAQNAKFTQDSFKTAVCQQITALFDCAGSMYIDVQTYSSFSGINNTVQYDADGKPITNYNPGSQSQIVVVRLMYPWPITVPLVRMYLADPSASTRLLVATAAFQNEPF
jgi:Flp pilus assembly protein TadG